jgi:hypothetical protein
MKHINNIIANAVSKKFLIENNKKYINPNKKKRELIAR